MNKTCFFRFFCALAVVIAANLLFWPPRENYLRTSIDPPPNSQRRIFERIMITRKPQIILLGNSILGFAVDWRQFSDATQKTTRIFKFGGGSSAWWYLTLKNIILTAPQKPQMVAIFFRDHYLTDPTYRVTGYYKQYIDWMTVDSEPILDRLAYQANQSPLIRCLARWSPLYQQKNRLNPAIQNAVKSAVMAVMPASAETSPDNAIENIFADKNMDRALFTARQLAAESVSSNQPYDFDDQVEKSFLPYMIEAAAENNVHLTFVRMKRRRDAISNQQPQALIDYIVKLKTYLQKHGCDYIDFTDDPRITENLYADGDHFSPQGQTVFTPLLIDAMTPIIRKIDQQGEKP